MTDPKDYRFCGYAEAVAGEGVGAGRSPRRLGGLCRWELGASFRRRRRCATHAAMSLPKDYKGLRKASVRDAKGNPEGRRGAFQKRRRCVPPSATSAVEAVFGLAEFVRGFVDRLVFPSRNENGRRGFEFWSGAATGETFAVLRGLRAAVCFPDRTEGRNDGSGLFDLGNFTFLRNRATTGHPFSRGARPPLLFNGYPRLFRESASPKSAALGGAFRFRNVRSEAEAVSVCGFLEIKRKALD